MEFQGPDAARPWLERAGAKFPTVVDAENVLGGHFGYKAIPNGILADEDGIVRYVKFSGFSVNNESDVQAVTALLQEAPRTPPSERVGPPIADSIPIAAAVPGAGSGGAGPTDTTDTAAASPAETAAIREGLARLAQGDRAGALASWRAALAADPASLVIRKQIWAVEHPERFYPTIDWAWQKDQLARDREREAG